MAAAPIGELGNSFWGHGRRCRSSAEALSYVRQRKRSATFVSGNAQLRSSAETLSYVRQRKRSATFVSGNAQLRSSAEALNYLFEVVAAFFVAVKHVEA